MRKLALRRWVTIAVMAAGLVGLTATSASADVWYYTPPPVDGTTFVVGPGCPNGTWGTYFISNTWYPTGGDYHGARIYGDNPDAIGGCDGTSYYIPDQATPDATFYWDIQADAPYWQTCEVYAYIPTVDAGDFNARYDFYAANINYVPGQWLGWPGATVDQYDYGSWTDLGGVNIPPNTPYLNVQLNNGDPNAPGYYTGAGDIALHCP